jgi:hypothetical protein
MARVGIRRISGGGVVPPVVYDRPIIGQSVAYETGDTYDQYITQNYWVQADGFKRVIDPTDFLLLKNLDSIGINNRNPHGDFRRFTSGNDPNDISLSAIDQNIPSSINYFRYIVDWLTGTAWLLTVYNSNKTFAQARDLVNTPYDGVSTPDWTTQAINFTLASNGLPYGFNDWKNPTMNHLKSIFVYPGGVNETLFNQFTGTLNHNIHTADVRIANNIRVRFDGIASWATTALTTANTSIVLYCRRILETDY